MMVIADKIPVLLPMTPGGRAGKRERERERERERWMDGWMDGRTVMVVCMLYRKLI